MSSSPLTAAQDRLLRFIETTLQRRGYPPSLDEMAQAMGAAFRSGVQVGHPVAGGKIQRPVHLPWGEDGDERQDPRRVLTKRKMFFHAHR
jgi:hypothetical protein